MKKEETIRRYGEAAYTRQLEQGRACKKQHREEEQAYQEAHRAETKAYNRKYKEEHLEQVIANSQEANRKGGKYYDHKLEYIQTGLQGDRNKIRMKHGKQYKPFKDIIAPDSQLHHEWIPQTSEYRGVALVEKDAHMHGFVDVIKILDGKITLLTEEEVRRVKK